MIMNDRSISLQKLYTLEEVSMTFWEVEKRRMAKGLTSEEKLSLEKASLALRELERTMIRTQQKDLLKKLKLDAKPLQELTRDIEAKNKNLDGLAARLEKVTCLLDDFLQILDKIRDEGLRD